MPPDTLICRAKDVRAPKVAFVHIVCDGPQRVTVETHHEGKEPSEITIYTEGKVYRGLFPGSYLIIRYDGEPSVP